MSERAPRALAIVALALLIVVAIWSTFVHLRDRQRMPDSDEIAAANAAIVDGFRDGDVIRHRPLWFANARIGLDGLPFLMSRHLDEYERHRFLRMWLITPSSHELAASDDRAWMSNLREVHSSRRLRVQLGDIVQTHPVYWDGYTDFEAATVRRIDADGGSRVCNRVIDGITHCGRYNEWIHVGPSIREMDDEPRHCIVANAPPDGDTWSITWEEVPLHEQFRFRAGNSLLALRSERGSPVRFAVHFGEDEVFRREWPIAEFGYPEFTIDTAARAGTTTSVEFRVHSADHFDRFFCFRPQVSGPSRFER